jgi:hypothetical protein
MASDARPLDPNNDAYVFLLRPASLHQILKYLMWLSGFNGINFITTG